MSNALEIQDAPFIASSSHRGTSSSAFSCCPPSFPLWFSSSLIDRLVQEVRTRFPKTDREATSSFAGFNGSGNSRANLKEEAFVEDLCKDGTVVLLRTTHSRRGHSAAGRRERRGCRGVITDAQIKQEEEAPEDGGGGHGPAHRPEAEQDATEPTGPRRVEKGALGQSATLGEEERRIKEKGNGGKRIGGGEQARETTEEGKGFPDGSAEDARQEAERRLPVAEQHYSRIPPDNISPWPGCLACISVTAAAIEEEFSSLLSSAGSASASVDTLRSLRQSDRPELKLSNFLFRVGNTHAVPECVNLALTEMLPGEAVRLYVHPSRGFRTLEEKTIRQLAAEDDCLLVDLTLHYWTIFENLTETFDFSSSTLFPRRKEILTPDTKEAKNNSSGPAKRASASSTVTRNDDTHKEGETAQQSSAFSAPQTRVMAGGQSAERLLSKTGAGIDKKSRSVSLDRGLEDPQERKAGGVCSGGGEEAMARMKREAKEEAANGVGRALHPCEGTKKRNDSTQVFETRKEEKANRNEDCEREYKGQVFLFSYNRLADNASIWRDAKALGDSSSFYSYRPHSDYVQNGDLTYVEVAYTLDSSALDIPFSTSRQDCVNENAGRGETSSPAEEILKDSSTPSTPCCPSIASSSLSSSAPPRQLSLSTGSPHACSSGESALLAKLGDSSLSTSSSLSGSSEVPSAASSARPLSESCSMATCGGSSSRHPSYRSSREGVNSPPSTIKREERSSVTVCGFHLDEDEAPFPGLEVLARHMRVGEAGDAWLSGCFALRSTRMTDRPTLSQVDAACPSRAAPTSTHPGPPALPPLAQQQDMTTREPSLSLSPPPSSCFPSPSRESRTLPASLSGQQANKEGGVHPSTQEGVKSEDSTSASEGKKKERHPQQSPACCLSLRGFVVKKAEHPPEPRHLRLVSEKMEMARLLRENGSGWYKRGRPDRALKRYLRSERFLTELGGKASEEDVAKARPELLLTRLNIAQCHLVLANYSAAKAVCEQLLRVDAENIKALYRLAKALAGLEDYHHAQQTARRALQLQPNNPDLRRLLASLNQHQRREDEEGRGYCKGIFT